jgi:hypothetical protein
MRIYIVILLLFSFCESYSQELDTYQNDSIYSKNKIYVRTMYTDIGDTLQKELVTYYNSHGKKLKQSWFFNGDLSANNTESFYYLNNGLLSYIINSIADGDTKKTTLFYDNNILKYQVTINSKKDTTDLRSFPGKTTTIQQWYDDGKPYRFDTTDFEKENVKIEYRGVDNIDGLRWRYNYVNSFDSHGNLIKVDGYLHGLIISSAKYFYDTRQLLIKKEETTFFSTKQHMTIIYTFIYSSPN